LRGERKKESGIEIEIGKREFDRNAEE